MQGFGNLTYYSRFDLMSGLNGQEGLLIYPPDTEVYAMLNNYSIAEGVDNAFTKDYLIYRCKTQYAPQSPNLCADYITNVYKLNEAADDRDRAVRLVEFLGM